MMTSYKIIKKSSKSAVVFAVKNINAKFLSSLEFLFKSNF
ncbi:hypothetical protein HMPREF9064_0725 [Aggregatibacter segnis ATCC 33393]|uniref:Uncharacterized protein n=1 Tax=Aggregatibacter segnis ATCC 33393 TaxID=888057 RepID=E6KX31_9PAST|nr:hypothetical protein HMPREF9064_0725 [Aggregatibacter segnis ATCC 33393]